MRTSGLAVAFAHMPPVLSFPGYPRQAHSPRLADMPAMEAKSQNGSQPSRRTGRLRRGHLTQTFSLLANRRLQALV